MPNKHAAERQRRLQAALRDIAFRDDTAVFEEQLQMPQVILHLPFEVASEYADFPTGKYMTMKFGRDLAALGWSTHRGSNGWTRWVKLRYKADAMLDNLNTWPNLEEDLRSYDTTDDDDDDDGDDDEEEDEEEEVPKVTRRLKPIRRLKPDPERAPEDPSKTKCIHWDPNNPSSCRRGAKCRYLHGDPG